MQSIFRKYIFITMSIAMLAILLMSYTVNERNIRERQTEAFNAKLDQIVGQLEQNRTEVENLRISLEEDYLTRARAVAYMIEKSPCVLESQEELERISENLDVDELHVFDAQGYIRYSSVPKYVGMSFQDGEQIGEFRKVLESDDPSSYLIQEARPNTAEGKVIQYVGVARTDEKGIVQVGLKPTRLLEAQKRNTYAYIFAHIPTDIGENLFAINMADGNVAGHTQEEFIDTNVDITGHTLEELYDCENGAFLTLVGARKFVVTRKYNDVLLGATMPRSTLYETLLPQMVQLVVYLFLTGVVVSWVLDHFLRNKIVLGIHRIIDDLEMIGKGRLDRTVNVKDVPEFAQLSVGINGMVEGILGTTVKLSRIIEMTGYPLAAYECRKDMAKVIATEQLKDILRISDTQAKMLYRDKEHFMRFMSELMEHPVAGEQDIYRRAAGNRADVPDSYIRVQTIDDAYGWFGVVCDVTEEYTKRQMAQYERDHDALTGLKNYRRFSAVVNERLSALRENRPENGFTCSAVMMDVDHFKAVNDNYGHDFGDTYLKHFAALIKEFSGGAMLTCRRSGDEFCLFFEGLASKAEVCGKMQEFFDMLKSHPVKMPDGQQGYIAISAGIGWMEDVNDTFDTLMARADQALYRAKAGGRGAFCEL